MHRVLACLCQAPLRTHISCIVRLSTSSRRWYEHATGGRAFLRVDKRLAVSIKGTRLFFLSALCNVIGDILVEGLELCLIV